MTQKTAEAFKRVCEYELCEDCGGVKRKDVAYHDCEDNKVE